MYEQGIQSILVQKQQFQLQQLEIESALKELEKTNDAYRIVGNIMVSSKKEELKKDMESKKEMLALRIRTLEKQENQIKEKATKLQSEVVGQMKEKD